MFFHLHRLYMISWASLIIGGIVWLYPRTGISEPLVDWYEVWQNNQGAQSKAIGRLTGQVVKVTDGSSFALRAPDRQFYSIGLLGMVPITTQTNAAVIDVEIAAAAKKRLSDLVLSNEVEVLCTWMDPLRRGVGIVHLGETNVNALLVQEGLLELKRDFIKGVPVREQYAMIKAHRLAREQKTARPH